MSRKSGYLRRKTNRKKKNSSESWPNRSQSQSPVDMKTRVFTLMSARHLGVLDDETRQGKYLTADYPMSVCIGVCNTQLEADELITQPCIEGEWK